ncbi:MAG: hypothetical protein IKP50_00475 [Bacilli bacterium]|nr:hypothetical protein [Bacilli bacterium]
MVLKEVFDKAENGSLTWEQFQALAKDAKFVDLNEGNYYSKAKHADELEAKDKQITTLNETIKTRDTDLATLKQQLADAGTDAAKLEELNGQLTDWQTKYDKDTKSYKEQLKKQAYEFAAKEYANSLDFSSEAAKRDFTQSLIAKNLQMEKDTILGADDFLNVYKQSNEKAFVVKEPEPETPPAPSFGQPTPPTPQSDVDDFSKLFTFDGVR